MSNPVINKGDKILCPQCKEPLLLVDQDLFAGDIISPNKFTLLNDDIVLEKGHNSLSPCCNKSWGRDLVKRDEHGRIVSRGPAALYTQDGWKPFDPFAGMH